MAADKSAAATFRLLWEAKPSARSSLGVGGIVEAAIALADAEGLAAVSMQRVAGELGYTAMALYRHVPGKDQLVALMADRAQGDPPAESGKDWRTEILNWADAAWDFYLAHPWMLRVATTGAPTGPNAMAWFEALLRPLARSGLATENLVATAMFISSAVRDLARIATEIVPSGPDYGNLLAQVVQPDRFPTLASLMASDAAVEDDGDVRPALDFGMALILDGLKTRTHPHTS
ncbi:TetR/AcrR family transcriptional regulator [Streptomyces sp. NPDC055721]|uniref:TetR/AcrR family transcriptional regulator n=1 Tax=Streptomyces sp. NPDC127132 TaxID=3345374 RepID=UPI00362D9BE8